MRRQPPILREKAFTALRLAHLLHNLLCLLGVHSGVVGGIARMTAIGVQGRYSGARRMRRIARFC